MYFLLSLKTGSTRLIYLSIGLESVVLKFPRTRSANLLDSNLNYSAMAHYIHLFLCYLRATFPIKVSTIRRRASLYTVECVTSFTSATFYSWCSFIEKPTRSVRAWRWVIEILLSFLSRRILDLNACHRSNVGEWWKILYYIKFRINKAKI